MPSQIVFAERAPIGRSAASESMYGAHASACTPTTRTPSSAPSSASADAAGEPAAAERDHHEPEVRGLAGQLEPDRALPRHHLAAGRTRAPSVIPSASASAARLRLSLVVAALHEAHLAAVLLHRRHLRERRLRRHHEHGARARLARGERHGLRVVAGARRDHAALERLRRERPDHVGGAARLERSGELEVLRLQQHARAHPARQLARREQRGLAYAARERAGGFLHVGEGHG